METTNQAPAQEPANSQSAPVQTPANDSLNTDLQKYVAEPSTADANAQQAPPQEPVERQNQQTAESARIAELQRIANEKQIEAYRYQQELERLRTQVPQQQQDTTRNPYDPTTQYDQWDSWRIQNIVKSAINENTQTLLSYAQQQSQQQQEIQWIQSHPGVDINQVKGFAQMRGIRDLNDAYTLMTLPNQLQNTLTQGMQAGIHQFRQPQQSATPLRGGQSGAPVQTQLSYAKLAEDYARTNGAVYSSWSPDLQKAFDAETYRRAEAGRG